MIYYQRKRVTKQNEDGSTTGRWKVYSQPGQGTAGKQGAPRLRGGVLGQGVRLWILI